MKIQELLTTCMVTIKRTCAALIALLAANAFADVADFYVATSGSDANAGTQEAPFASLAAAITAANAAIDGGAESAVVHVGAGTYTGSGYELDRAITVIGEDGTVFDGNGGYRVFSLTSSGAALKGLVVSNGVFTAAGQSGAGVYMEAGLVEDCRIASCGSFNPSQTLGGGIYASGGRISRTVFTDCRVHMRWSSDVGYGSALYLSNGAVCENSLFTGNAAVPCPDFDATYRRGGVVHMTGDGSVLVNCTVVKNNLGDPAGSGNIVEKFSGIVSLVKAKVVNCVAYGNIPDASYATASWDVYAGGDEWRNNWQNYVSSSGWGTGHYRDGTAEPSVSVDKSAFADYANGNYAPAPGGPLFGAGSDEQYASYAASATDLAGVPRPQGSSVEIGCYEVDERTLTLTVEVDSCAILLGATSTFTAAAAGGSSYKYKWDFGDGSEELITENNTVQHTYPAGLHSASVAVSVDGGTTWAKTAEPPSAIVVAPADIYVNASNANPAFPYDTPTKAATTFADAYGCLTNTLPATADTAVANGVTIHVAAGTYTGSGYVLAGAITVLGTVAETTIFDGNGGYRIFSLTSSDASLKNLTVSNGAFTTAEQAGAGIYMKAGLVEDCAITSCGTFTPYETYGGGVYASGGRISRTKFTGNKVHMLWSSNVGYGSALYLSDGAVCENSLFTGNAPAPCLPFNSSHYRGGVVYLTGEGTALVNCTVVQNTIRDTSQAGNVTEKFAGIVQKNKAKVVNCVAYGNIPDAGTATSNGDVCAGGDTHSGGNWESYFVNSAWSTGIPFNNDPGTPSPASTLTVTADAFKNYANGDFRPKYDGVLVNAGTTWADYLTHGGLSVTDFAGKQRMRAGQLDIGCYEGFTAGLFIVIR